MMQWHNLTVLALINFLKLYRSTCRAEFYCLHGTAEGKYSIQSRQVSRFLLISVIYTVSLL